MTSDLVSVVIPTYNRARLVVGAIDSALGQLYPSIEVIVVDDGSSDDTEQVLGAAFGDGIRYIRQENQGVSAARNRGLSEASGQLIAFLDSDDAWLPQKTSVQVAYLERRPDFGMVVCDYFMIDADGTVESLERRRQQYGPDGWVLGRISKAPMLVPSTALLRRSVYEEIGGFDTSLRTAEDIDFLLRVAARYPIGVVEKPLVRYADSHDSLSRDVSSYRDYVRVVRRFVKENWELLSRTERHEAIYSAQLKLARGLMWDGNIAGAMTTCARCLPHVTRVTHGIELAALAARLTAYSVMPWRRKSKLDHDDLG